MTIAATGSVLHQGLIGMQNSSAEISEAAQTIARAGRDESQPLDLQQDIVEPLVEMKVETLLFEASAKVVSTADDMIGALLDVEA